MKAGYVEWFRGLSYVEHQHLSLGYITSCVYLLKLSLYRKIVPIYIKSSPELYCVHFVAWDLQTNLFHCMFMLFDHDQVGFLAM